MDFSKYAIMSFDCYGTLIDWDGGITGALQPLLQHHGHEMEAGEVLTLYAELEAEIEGGAFRPYREVLNEVVLGVGRTLGFTPSLEEAGALAASLGDWLPFPDTVAALRRLRDRFKLAVLSNIDADLFDLTATHLQVVFDYLVTAEQVKSYKPAKAHFQRLLDAAGADPADVVHVAQSRYHDIATAREMGMATVWVNRRKHQVGSGATPNSDATPDLEVHDLATLVEIISAAAPS